MRKILLISLAVFVSYLIEFFLFNLGGRWFMPNLLLLVVVYFNLAFGIRYSIFAAVLSGVFADSFGTGVFGINIFSYVLCAFMATFLKRYLHYVASRSSRLILVFSVTIVHLLTHFFLKLMMGRVEVLEIIRYVFIPEIITTLIVTSFFFAQLRKCVLKLSV